MELHFQSVDNWPRNWIEHANYYKTAIRSWESTFRILELWDIVCRHQNWKSEFCWWFRPSWVTDSEMNDENIIFHHVLGIKQKDFPSATDIGLNHVVEECCRLVPCLLPIPKECSCTLLNHDQSAVWIPLGLCWFQQSCYKHTTQWITIISSNNYISNYSLHSR